MDFGRPRRDSWTTDLVDENGNSLWHGVKLGEHWKTDMQVAINDSNRRQDAFFKLRMGRAGTTNPYQQAIPTDFGRRYKNLFNEPITLEAPTGQTWSTVIRDYQKVMRFGKGWREFTVENHLQEGYLLLFTLVGKFRFLVQFFDHLGKRCTSYPPLPVAQSGPLPVAQTQRRPYLRPGSQPGFQQVVYGGQAYHRHGSEVPDLQRGFQQVVDGGQAYHRHGSEAQTSAAVPLMGATPSFTFPLNSNLNYVIRHQYESEVPSEPTFTHKHVREPEEHTFDAGNGSEDMDIEDEGDQGLDEARIFVYQGRDIDEVPIYHRPAAMPTLIKPELNIHTLNEISRGKQPMFPSPDNRAEHSSPIQDHNNSPSSGGELPLQYYPETQKKQPVRVNRPERPVAPPVASYHEAGGSSGSSPAMRVLQQQGCRRFSRIVLNCERRDVSTQERHVVVEAAKQFVSALEDEKFLVVMREEQVYHTFHLAIPERILEATGTERKSKAEVWLLDREQALCKTHWTKQNFCDTPLLECDAWAKFAVDHSLEEGDVCVFQLLEFKPAVSIPAFHFCVHIFRVVESPVGQLDFSDAVDRR